MKKILNSLHLLSLDVVIGTMICSIAFWKLPLGSGMINWPSVFILGSSTWLIYIIDRILDLRLLPDELSNRHSFHAQNRQKLLILVGLLFAINISLVFVIPFPILQFGLVLSLILFFYFIILNFLLKSDKLQGIKEPATSIFYCIAVLGPSFIMQPSLNLSSYILGFLFFLIVFQNLLLFSYFEYLNHKGVKNIVSSLGLKLSKFLLKFISISVLIIIGVLFWNGRSYSNFLAFTLGFMSSLFLYIGMDSSYFRVNERYRLADLVFFLPLILFLFF